MDDRFEQLFYQSPKEANKTQLYVLTLLVIKGVRLKTTKSA